MAAITADAALKVEDETKLKSKASETVPVALILHLAAGRFGSPAGMAFLPQSYLPFLSRRWG